MNSPATDNVVASSLPPTRLPYTSKVWTLHVVFSKTPLSAEPWHARIVLAEWIAAPITEFDTSLPKDCTVAPTKYSDLTRIVPELTGTTTKRNSPVPSPTTTRPVTSSSYTFPLSSTVILKAYMRAVSDTKAPCGDTAVIVHRMRSPASTVEFIEVHVNVDCSEDKSRCTALTMETLPSEVSSPTVCCVEKYSERKDMVTGMVVVVTGAKNWSTATPTAFTDIDQS